LHPAAYRFWFHGDDDPVERLRLLDTYLNEFEARPVSGFGVDIRFTGVLQQEL
jgi:hypothetical protein